MNLSNFLCSESESLLGVLRVINNNTKGIAFIIDKNNKLKGVITDGDIRRALLNEKSLDTIVLNILQDEFMYGTVNESYDDLRCKVNGKIKILPIVSKNGEVVDFFEYRTDVHIPVSFPHLKGNELKYLTDAFLSTWISSSGKYIELFEKTFADFSECRYGVAVSNGTVAIHLALKALGIGAGDEVIVPDLTFAATINAVLHANAIPVIVDVEKEGWCIDPKEIRKAITPKTKAIIPVHIYGQPCNMVEIMEIATEYDLYVIEDCAEAHGATFKGKKVGSYGHISCFSFFANKVVTTGEGGMCVTNDESLNGTLRLLRDHGMSKKKKYWHEEIGYNYRMTNLQAALGVAQMERIEQMLTDRMEIEQRYKGLLDKVDTVSFQKTFSNRKKIVWLVSILVEKIDRDKVLAELRSAGFDTRPFFYPLSLMDIYKEYIFSNVNSIEISKRGLNLPTYIGISEQEIEDITLYLKKILESIENVK